MDHSLSKVDSNRHTEEIQEIISAPPSWLLRWGIFIFLIMLSIILALSVVIRYPEVIKTQLVINLTNKPKSVVSKVSGKVIKLFVLDNETVFSGEPLAYLESTANHTEVLTLIDNLKKARESEPDGTLYNDLLLGPGKYSDLGELQGAYQTFYESYLKYHTASSNGLYIKRKIYLQNDLKNIEKQSAILNEQRKIQQQDYEIATEQYKMHQKLLASKVETEAEFRNETSTYLSKKSPLIQTDESLLNMSASYQSKKKEMTELENQAMEDKMNFIQALNSLISQANDWKNKFILTAPQTGKISFVSFVQENQTINIGQEIFLINPGNENFFGQMRIPQNNMGKIAIGQRVLIKLKSFPFEEYGILTGKITYISDVIFQDSAYISKVSFFLPQYKNKIRPIVLKSGMIADAEIITEDISIFDRISRTFTKMLK